MLTKVVILLFATTAFAFNVGTTPEELKEYIKHVEEALKENEHEAQNDIRANLEPLLSSIAEANEHIFHDLSELAQPYWQEIESIEREAEGQHVFECIELGNHQLYQLNATTTEPLVHEIASYLERGNEIIEESSVAVSGPIEELLALEGRVEECSEIRCADELKEEVDDLFEKASELTSRAKNEAHDYVFVDLPEHLAKLRIDGERYEEAYTPILREVNECVRDL